LVSVDDHDMAKPCRRGGTDLSKTHHTEVAVTRRSLPLARPVAKVQFPTFILWEFSLWL
jgi:hypothetical protein